MRYWVAQYNDNTSYPSTLEEAKLMVQKYDEIDREKLVCFDVWENDKLKLRVHFDEPEKRLIYRKRHLLIPGQGEQVIWLVGWQKKVQGKNVQSINLIFPDGHIESIGRWSTGILTEPNLRDFEK